MSTETPEKLYKYCAQDIASRILQSRTLRWSSPAHFCDGLELNHQSQVNFDREKFLNTAIKACSSLIFGHEQPRGDTALIAAIRRWRDTSRFNTPEEAVAVLRELLSKMVDHRMEVVAQLTEKWIEHINQTRICCFIEKPDNLTAWQKYGDGLKGISLRFAMGSDSSLGTPKAIHYANTRPEITSIKEQLGHLVYNTRASEEDDFKNKNLVKPPIFRLEKEWRCFKTDTNVGPQTDTKDTINDLPFENNELTAIYFGAHMKEEQKRALALLAKENFATISLYQTRFAPMKYDLLIEPYNLN